MEWFFDGLGTELIIVFISLFFGGIAGGLILYKVNIDKKTIKQNQKAKDKANQSQIGVINYDGKSSKTDFRG